MKIYQTFLPFILLLLSLSSFAQKSEVKTLVKQGIELHDSGDYKGAIEIYKKALIIEPNSSLVNYEIAISYQSNNDFKNAEKYSKKVIDLNDGNMLPGYIAYANALDMLGNQKEAIKVYEQALKDFNHYLLYYNYGLTCFNIGDLDKAYDASIEAIQINPNHGSSHLLLSKIMDKKGNRVKAMLPLYFFLLIEPNTERSAIEYQNLRNYLDKGVTQTSKKNIDVAVPINNDSDFGAAEIMISLTKAASSLPENKGKDELQLFAEHNESIFKILGELKKDNTGFWWDLYVTLFYNLAQDDLTKIYSYYISLSTGEKALSYIDAHNEDFEKFKNWMQ